MRKKKIAINALSALQGGGQTYLVNLLRYAKDYKDMEFTVYCNPKFKGLFDLENVTAIGCDFASKGLIQRVLWEKFVFPRILKKEKIDLVFCPGGILGFKAPPSCKTAVAFQNMLIFDEASRKKYGFSFVRLRFKLLEMSSIKSFKNTDLLIFISEHAKNVIDGKIPQRNGKSIIVSHGISEDFLTYRKEGSGCVLNLPEKYILYVSGISVYKHQIEVLKAYEYFIKEGDQDVSLVFVGSAGYVPYLTKLKFEIDSRKLAHRVFLRKFPHEEMPKVYKNAIVNIFASSCENCPNILLEMMGAGKLNFVSDIEPMKEFAQDSCIYFNPYDPLDLASKLIENFSVPKIHREYSKKAFQRALDFNWEKTAERTFEGFWKTIDSGKETP
jgi:glycosyltransferase involved in cell wall biosynthesis